MYIIIIDSNILTGSLNSLSEISKFDVSVGLETSGICGAVTGFRIKGWMLRRG